MRHFIALVKARRGSKLNASGQGAVFRRISGRRTKRLNSDWPIAWAICARPCASALARKVYTPLISAERSLLGRRLPGVGFCGRDRALSRPCRRPDIGAGSARNVEPLRPVVLLH